MAKVVNTAEAKDLINSEEVVIIDFFATWCGPCQMFGPNFDEVSNEIEGATLIKVDIDQDTDFAAELNVLGVPTIVGYKNGEEVKRFSGFKSITDLKDFVEEVKCVEQERVIKKFKVVKNTYSVCYEATEDGEITTNELHNGSVITYKKGDWICNDPNNENDIWPIEKSIHGNYTKSNI